MFSFFFPTNETSRSTIVLSTLSHNETHDHTHPTTHAKPTPATDVYGSVSTLTLVQLVEVVVEPLVKTAGEGQVRHRRVVQEVLDRSGPRGKDDHEDISDARAVMPNILAGQTYEDSMQKVKIESGRALKCLTSDI